MVYHWIFFCYNKYVIVIKRHGVTHSFFVQQTVFFSSGVSSCLPYQKAIPDAEIVAFALGGSVCSVSQGSRAPSCDASIQRVDRLVRITGDLRLGLLHETVIEVDGWQI